MTKYLTIVLAAVIAGCAVGPDYKAPEMTEAETFFAQEAKNSSDASHLHSPQLYSPNSFWQGFDDPLLAGLVKRTLNNNYTLQAMLARYREAESVLRLARREQWPSITSYADVTDQSLARSESGVSGTVYDAGLALQWELDLFGRLERATEAALASLQASGADLQAMQVVLVGQLTSSYIELRGMQNQLAVTENNIALQQSSLQIVESRVRAGRGSRFDILRARAQLEATRAAVPELRAGIRAHMHRIAVLTGQSPHALIAELQESSPLPYSVHSLVLDAPGDVLRNRPDIRAAERKVAAATARIGVATADLFPRFTLSGLLGSYATSASDLFESGSDYRRVTLGIDWTFLDRAQVNARINAADASAEAQLASYRQAVLDALEEVETWLVRHQQAKVRAAVLTEAVSAAEQAVAQATTRYERGYIDYFELLTTELELTRIRDAHVRSQTAESLTMVNVYRAVAGAPEPFIFSAKASVSGNDTEPENSVAPQGEPYERG